MIQDTSIERRAALSFVVSFHDNNVYKKTSLQYIIFVYGFCLADLFEIEKLVYFEEIYLAFKDDYTPAVVI